MQDRCICHMLVKMIVRLLDMRQDMRFEVYWDGACGPDKIKTFAPMGVKALSLELLFCLARVDHMQKY